MPIIEAGFSTPDNHPDPGQLIFFGPTVPVIVGTYDPDNNMQAISKAVHALIDTGATESCIDMDLAIELGLPVVDTRTVGGVGGVSKHNVYMAHINIPQLEQYQFGQFTGVGLKAGGQQHEVLLGRTFLKNTIMIYDGIRGQVTLTANKIT